MDEDKNKKDENVEEKIQEETSTYEPQNDVQTSYEPEVVETTYESTVSKKKEKKEKIKKEKNSSEQEPKKKSSIKIGIISIFSVVILVAIITAIYYLFFASQTIDLANHLSITYDGYDGYAVASVDFKSSLKKEFEDSSVYKKFKKKAELEIISDNNGELKNGDTIKVKVSISNSWLEENKVNLKDKTIKLKVSGVPEPEKIDLFKDLKYTFTGVSPNLSLSVSNNGDHDFLDTVYYSLSDSYGLANGDTITITASYSEYDTKEMGVIVEEDTFEYTIENQAYYANKKEDITEAIIEKVNADMIKDIKNNLDYGKYDAYYEHCSSSNFYASDLVAGEPTLVNLYLLVPNTNKDYYSYYNYIYGVYKTTYTAPTGETYDWYFTTYAYNLELTPEGEIQDYSDSSYAYYSYGKSSENLFDKSIKKTDYTSITIK